MRTTVVMLAGMMCDARLFAPQADMLAHDYDVLVPPPAPLATMTELASDILDKAPERFALCGLSMGGIIAMEMMAQAPQRVSHLALLDTNPLAETEAGIIRRNRQIEDVKAGRLAQIMAEEMKPMYLADSPDSSAILDICMEMALTCGDEIFITQSRALRDRPDQTDTLKAVTCPTLILQGADDRLCPADRHMLMHQLIPHAEYIQIEGAGHLPPLEQPEKTLAALKSWLSG